MKVTLNLTHRCNLSCSYCYGGKKVLKDMSLHTAQKAVDFAVEITPPDSILELNFFGGEPLLCFDLMNEVIKYIREMEEKSGKRVSLSITTNGTLLSDSIFDTLVKEDISLCISIDGPENIHNTNRCYKDGRGSFKDVVDNLQEAIKHVRYVQINAVYEPETISFLPESVAFFSNFDVSGIHLNPNMKSSWTRDIYSKFGDIYMKIADFYIDCYQSGQEIAINLIDSKIVLFLKGGYTVEDMCGMGETEWGIAPSGNIYPCERFIGEDKNGALCIGNVHTGFDSSRRCSVLKERGNFNAQCNSCSIQKYCMNWCGCTNYYATGNTGLVGAFLCESEKAAIKASNYVLATLTDLDNELFIDHFMQYVHEGRRQ